MRFPPLPEVPEPVRGRSFVIVELASQLDDEATDGHLVPMWTLDPEIETVRRIPVPQLADLHMDPPEPVPATVSSSRSSPPSPSTRTCPSRRHRTSRW